MAKPRAFRIVESVMPNQSVMPHQAIRRRKPALTGHQKQIRFFTRVSVVLCSLLTFAVFWLVNRMGPGSP
jgi:hypothetical protein